MDKQLILVGAATAIGVFASVGIYYLWYDRGRRSRLRRSEGHSVARRRLKTFEKLDDPIAQYLLEHNTEDPVLNRLRKFSASLSNGRMATPVEEGNLLTILCKAIGARKVIDIGVFTGCSAYAMALGLPTGGKVVACDVNLDDAKKGQPYWEEGGVADKIDLRIKPATETLQELVDNKEEGTYDMVFIDADKKNYPVYYQNSFKLLRSGGFIVVDNAIFTGTGNAFDSMLLNENTKGLRTLNRMMKEDERIHYVLLDLVEGIGLGLKK